MKLEKINIIIWKNIEAQLKLFYMHCIKIIFAHINETFFCSF